MSDMTSFIIGSLSSIFAAAFIFIFRFNIGFIINFLFYKIYPNVAGEYNVYGFRTQFSDKTGGIKKSPKALFYPIGAKPSNQKLLQWLKGKNRKTYVVIKLKQFANRVSGEVYSIKKDKIKHLEKIDGRITPSRVLILNFESKDVDHHNYGTYLLVLTNDLHLIRGTKSGLCYVCGDTMTQDILLEKK